MDALTDPEIEEIWVMKSAQTGWTEILGNTIGYFIDGDPSPMLLIQPTLEMAEAYSKDRLAPMLRDTPCLQGKVRDARARDSGNTLLHKVFPGGHITMAGANSPAGLASRPIRILLCDEIDRFPESAGAEGDPVKLASKRTTTFWNRKKLFGSTPTVKGASRIEKGFNATDQRRYWVPCPHCMGFQVLVFSNIKWPKGKPEEAYYLCAHCAAVIVDNDKHQMLMAGEWRASREAKGRAGFHIWEAYSPWVTFAQIAQAFMESKDDPLLFKTFVNTSLGETWEVKGEQPEWIALQQREEPYQPMTCPADALFLTAGIDVQSDKIFVVIVAWGKGEESWRIGFHTIHGDTSAYPSNAWDDLSELLALPIEHELGVRVRIESAAIDSGHRTQCVYNFARENLSLVIPVKGQSVSGKVVLGQPTPQDISYQGRKIKNGVQLWPVGSDTAKDAIYARLKITDGPGRYHFPAGMGEEYYHQLTAEKKIAKTRRGKIYYEWVVTGENHALDCEVYAYAAALRAGLTRMNWDARRQMILGAKAGAKASASPSASRRIISRGVQ